MSRLQALEGVASDLVGAQYTEPDSLRTLSLEAADALELRPDPVPLVLIHVDGGIAEEWYAVEGVGKPEAHILDFDREGETDEEKAEFIAVATEVLALFKARGVDTSDLDADLGDL